MALPTIPTLRDLSKSAGLPVPPASPLAASALGATPKSADMAGTPNQIQANLKKSQAEQEKAVKSYLGNIQATTASLGNTKARVARYIEAQKNKLATASVAPQAVADPAALPPGTDVVALKTALSALSSDPGNLTKLAAVNTLLKRPPGNLLSPEDLSGLYENSVDAIASGAAGVLDTDLTLSDLSDEAELTSLADSIGVGAEAVGKMSLRELSETVDAQSQQLARSLDLFASSALAGAAERGLAVQGARDVSLSGIRAAEASIDALATAVARSDRVTVAGTEYSASDLLGDGEMSDFLAGVAEAGEGSELWERLKKEEPELFSFIENNQAAIVALHAELRDTSAQLSTAQSEYANVGVFHGDTSIRLNNSILSSLIPGYDPSKIQVGLPEGMEQYRKSALFTALNRATPTQAASIVQAVNGLSSKSPELMQEILSLDEGELAELSDPVTLAAIDLALKDAGVIRERESVLSSLDSSKLAAGDADSVVTAVRAVTGNQNLTIQDINTALSQGVARSKLGFAAGELSDLLDKNKDGRVDDLSGLVSSAGKQTSVVDIARGRSLVSAGGISTALPSLGDLQRRASELVAAGPVTRDSFRKAGFSVGDIRALSESGIVDRMGGEAIFAVDEALRAHAKTNAAPVVAAIKQRTSVLGDGLDSMFGEEAAARADEIRAELDARRDELSKLSPKDFDTHLIQTEIRKLDKLYQRALKASTKEPPTAAVGQSADTPVNFSSGGISVKSGGQARAEDPWLVRDIKQAAKKLRI